MGFCFMGSPPFMPAVRGCLLLFPVLYCTKRRASAASTYKGGEGMFLIKCKCGCIFTVKSVERHSLTCQNCKESVPFFKQMPVSDAFLIDGIEIRAIPDNAKITVTFDA